MKLHIHAQADKVTHSPTVCLQNKSRNQAEKQLPVVKHIKILRLMLAASGQGQAFQPFPHPPPKQSRFAIQCQGHHTRGSLSAGILACSLQQWKDSQER